MARQVIQSGPSERSLRQRAFEEGLSNVTQGLKSISRTKRQEALDEERRQEKELQNQRFEDAQALKDFERAQSLSLASGQTVLPGEVTADAIAQSQIESAPDFVGPQAPSTGRIGQIMGAIGEKKRAQDNLAAEDRDLDRKFKMVQMGAIGNKNLKEQEKIEKEKRERLIPGFGSARTKEEAKDIRTAQADLDATLKTIDEIKELGTNIGPFDKTNRDLIGQKIQKLVGGLRLAFTGPGILDKAERAALIESIGDPRAFFSTEEIEKAKLDELAKTLTARVNASLERSAQLDPQELAKGAAADLDPSGAIVLKKPPEQMSRQERDNLRRLINHRRGFAAAPGGQNVER